jgi:hypothetical protein
VWFARDCRMHELAGVAYSGCGMVVNCTADYLDNSGTINHPDVYQFFNNQAEGNVILYGLTATSQIFSQGFFCGDNIPLRDCAIVNCSVDNSGTESPLRAFSIGGPTRHMFVKNTNVVGGTNLWATAPDQNFDGRNVVVENSTFSPPLNVASGVTVR